MGSTEGDTHPIPGAPGYYLVHELQLELVQVQASLAPAVPLPGGKRCHGTAKAARSVEHQTGHLLSPKHGEGARPKCTCAGVRALHRDMVLSLSPWQPT